MAPFCTRLRPCPFFEAITPGGAPGPPVQTGARVLRFWGCNDPSPPLSFVTLSLLGPRQRHGLSDGPAAATAAARAVFWVVSRWPLRGSEKTSKRAGILARPPPPLR